MMSFFEKSLSLEARVLISLLGQSAKPVQMPEQPVDWAVIQQIAAQHEITSTLYDKLRQAALEPLRRTIPSEVLEPLRHSYHVGALKNRLITTEMLDIIDLLGSQGIPAIPFKGPILAVMAYNSLAARQFGDLDIFIHKHDLDGALKLLFARGYQFPPTEVVSPRSYERYHRELWRQDTNSHIELHWDFAPFHTTFSIERAGLWQHLIPVTLLDRIVQTFSVDDQLIILSVHGTKHVWLNLKLVCDMAELVRLRGAADWQPLLVSAARLGMERKLLLGLALAHSVFNAPLPDSVLDRIQTQPILLSIASEITSRWFDTVERPIPANSYLANHRYNYFLNPRLASRWLMARILLRRLVSVSEHDKAIVKLPAPLTFLYYLKRPFRLLTSYGLPWTRPRQNRPNQDGQG